MSLGIDAALVRKLVAEQFPHWADLPIRPVEVDGWDNRTFRLGGTMSVRLPSAPGYAPQVEKEQRWLPVLAPHLPLPIPVPLAMGTPGAGYPFHWSVNRWIEGQTARLDRIDDLTRFAVDLAEFLSALQRVDATDGPAAGAHSCFRGASLSHYDTETRHAIDTLRDQIPAALATEVWQTACEANSAGRPVWFHGDVATGNLLVRRGRLTGVIDFGTSGVGDPACDVTIAWTLFSGRSRRAFRTALAVDPACWARARGWALWKALITITRPDPVEAMAARHVLDEVLIEYRQSSR
ncbi:MAG TPA: aminoglycoside phosphotransferase family protein [Micromonospora sp.]